MEGDIQYAEALAQKGVRPSIQRIAIYKFLSENHIHPTVDMVFKALYPLYPTLSRTTVYNTLHLFVLQNLVHTVKIEDDEVRYDADLREHAHFKCVNCGKVFDIFSDDIIPPFYEKAASLLPEGFKGFHREMNIWGLCDNCSSLSDSSK